MNLEQAEKAQSAGELLSRLTACAGGEKESCLLLENMMRAMEAEVCRQNARNLAVKIRAEFSAFSDSDLEIWRLLMSSAFQGSFFLEDPNSAALLREFLIHSSLQNDKVAKVYSSGKPKWLDDSLIKRMQCEAIQLRPNATRRSSGRGFSTDAGPVGKEIADILRQEHPDMEVSGEHFYLYYEGLGDGAFPHLDRGAFSINALIGVDQNKSISSKTLIYGTDGMCFEFALTPGEMLLFDAGMLFHGRSSLSTDESVTVLTVGLRLRHG